MNHTITLMITGGHVTPAIATIEAIQRSHPNWRLIFIGRKYSLEGTKVLSEEYRLIHDLGLAFMPITAGRLKRDFGMGTFFSLLKVPVGFAQAFILLFRKRPDGILSFGGYVALPVALCAKLLGIPVVTHEQTTRPGLANRIIARIASRVCVSFAESTAMLPKTARVEVTGLPVRSAVLTPPKTPPFLLSADTPVLFIVGGSTGSVSINKAVFAALKQLLADFTVVHQVGRLSVEAGKKAANSLPPALQKRYIHKAFFSAEEYSWALHHGTIIIGRAGANTVTELALSGAVAVLIPLPWSAGNEQFHNAKVLEKAGSILLEQRQLTASSLIAAVKRIMTDLPERKEKARALAAVEPRDGAERLTRVVSEVLTPRR